MIVSAKIGIFRRTSALTVCFLAVCDPNRQGDASRAPLPQQFPHAGFSSIDIFQCVKSVQQFYQVHGAARPPHGRGIGRYVIYVVTLGLKCAHIKLSGKRQSNGWDFCELFCNRLINSRYIG